jgi:hypothetical protein
MTASYPTVQRSTEKSNIELCRNRTKSMDNRAGVRSDTSPPEHCRRYAAARLIALGLVLACLMVVSRHSERPSWSWSWSEYVRVSANIAQTMPLDDLSASPVLHRAGWIWDVIDIIEEFLSIGSEEDDEADDDETSDGGVSSVSGGDDSGDSAAGSVGTGDGDGSAGDPQEAQGDADDSNERFVGDVIQLVSDADLYFDDGYEYSESIGEDELIKLLLDLLEFLYHYAEMTSSG